MICEACCCQAKTLYLGLCAECIGVIEEAARKGDGNAQDLLATLAVKALDARRSAEDAS